MRVNDNSIATGQVQVRAELPTVASGSLGGSGCALIIQKELAFAMDYCE